MPNTELIKQNGRFVRADNSHPISFDDQGNLVDQVTGETGSMQLPEVVVKPQIYSSSFDGSFDNFLDTTNALTGGLLNRTVPSQNIGLVRDTYKWLNGDMSRTDWTNRLIFGNSGAVDEDYAEEHPISSFFINLGTDMASAPLSYGAWRGVKPLANNIKNYTRARIISRELAKNIKNFDGTVSGDYFNSPSKWYRITESPEVGGIKEMGKNVTTKDAEDMFIPSDNFRSGVIDNNLTFRDGYWYKPLKKRFNLSKDGSAHGNTSQAAKGQIWQGTTAASNKFPRVILEGDMPVQTYRGFNSTTGLDSRSSFHLVNSETIPKGARIGFHTGEMPIENLSSFTKLSNGRYRYDGPVIPYKALLHVPQNASQVPTYFIKGASHIF